MMARKVFSEIQVKKAVRIARTEYGDQGRVVIHPDGSITIEKGEGKNERPTVKKPAADFVL